MTITFTKGELTMIADTGIVRPGDAKDLAKFALGKVDELEVAGHCWSAQEDHINQQSDRIESLENKNSGLGKALGAAEKRIAEFESERDKQGRRACELFDEVANQRQQIAELVAAGIITKVGE